MSKANKSTVEIKWNTKRYSREENKEQLQQKENRKTVDEPNHSNDYIYGNS